MGDPGSNHGKNGIQTEMTYLSREGWILIQTVQSFYPRRISMDIQSTMVAVFILGPLRKSTTFYVQKPLVQQELGYPHCSLLCINHRASQLVLRLQKETINSLHGNISTTLQSIAAVITAANTAALEASKEIEAAMNISMGRAALDLVANEPNEVHFDELTILKETLRVKDEELQRLAKEVRAKDSTLKEIANKLKQTAEAAKAAEDAARKMDDERRLAYTEIERLTKDAEKEMLATLQKLKESEEKVMALSKEREVLLNQRDSAFQGTQLLHSEVLTAKEHALLLEATANKAEVRARIAEADSNKAKLKDAENNAVVAAREKDELKALVNNLQSQLQREHSNTKQAFDEKPNSCSMTEHLSDDNVDADEC